MTQEVEMFCGRRIVLKSLTGSHNYNLNTPTSDKDYKYFVCPTFDDMWAGKMFSTAKQSKTLDYDCHDIRQLVNLWWKSNINFIEILFSAKIEFDPLLKPLFAEPERFATMNLPTFKNATYGMHLQKMSELFKGTANTDILLERFGYDTKQACHALRCLFVLERFAKTGSMEKSLRFNKVDPERKILIDVKQGVYSLEDFRLMVADWHRDKKDAVMNFYKDFQNQPEIFHEAEDVVKKLVRTYLV